MDETGARRRGRDSRENRPTIRIRGGWNHVSGQYITPGKKVNERSQATIVRREKPVELGRNFA